MSVTRNNGPTILLAEQHIISLYRLLTTCRNYMGNHHLFNAPTVRELLAELDNAIREIAEQAQRNARKENGTESVELLTVAQVAELTGYSERLIQLRAKELGAIKVKGRWAIPQHLVSYLREDTHND